MAMDFAHNPLRLGAWERVWSSRMMAGRWSLDESLLYEGPLLWCQYGGDVGGGWDLVKASASRF